MLIDIYNLDDDVVEVLREHGIVVHTGFTGDIQLGALLISIWNDRDYLDRDKRDRLEACVRELGVIITNQ